MAYDPCGTQRLEGDEILKRLAVYLGVPKQALKQVLIELAEKKNIEILLEVSKNNP